MRRPSMTTACLCVFSLSSKWSGAAPHARDDDGSLRALELASTLRATCPLAPQSLAVPHQVSPDHNDSSAGADEFLERQYSIFPGNDQDAFR